MTQKCECGRMLCDLCEEKAARFVMENRYNGNTLNVCVECYMEIWGEKGANANEISGYQSP